jgi:hypothetical protein
MDHIVKNIEKNTPRRRYFTKETEEAIVKYNNTSDINEKNKIYEKHIHYPFFKLTQNIINKFKFHYMDEPNIEDLQHKIILFLIEKLHKFDHLNGAKAYSYFGTITKRWLIDYNKKQYKIKLKRFSIEDKSDDESLKYEDTPNSGPLDFEGFKEKDKLYLFLDIFTEYCTNNLYILFSKDEETKTADAILEQFRKRDKILTFNKKEIYLLIKEIYPECNSLRITKVAKKLKTIFYKNYMYYLKYDEINFDH